MRNGNPTIDSKFRVSYFSTAYLPPVSYFIALLKADKVLLEANENYVKQSYRNRCNIATANGVETLTIPTESNNGEKIPIRDVRISKHGGWQKNHWRAINSAYRNSPYFEYLQDDFAPFYEKNWTFLWDYNYELLILILDFLSFEKTLILTKDFENEYQNMNDFRYLIHPKKESIYNLTPYYQVFDRKFGFLEDLSIMDLIFNMGNEAIPYLFHVSQEDNY
ncbi:MAG: WbqC family protein [Paludibacteraceae bacterium]